MYGGVPAHAFHLFCNSFPDGGIPNGDDERSIWELYKVPDTAKNRKTRYFLQQSDIIIQKSKHMVAGFTDNVRNDLPMSACSDNHNFFTHELKPPFP